MTATTSPAQIRKPRPIFGLVRRLGVQAGLSVTVMAGLQFASINGYDIRDLLPAPAPVAARPAETGPVGVPARFDSPVQAGSAIDPIVPEPSAEAAASGASPKATARPPGPPRVRVAALPGLDRVAVPTPRPRPAAARPAAIPPRPGEMSFDDTPRSAGAGRGIETPRAIEVHGVAELGAEELPPMPMDVADAGFRVRDLVPSGDAILTRTAEVTGSATHVVTGTAARILDLVR